MDTPDAGFARLAAEARAAEAAVVEAERVRNQADLAVRRAEKAMHDADERLMQWMCRHAVYDVVVTVGGERLRYEMDWERNLTVDPVPVSPAAAPGEGG